MTLLKNICRLDAPSRCKTDQVIQLYYLNINIIIGVSLSLVATRVYGVVDSPGTLEHATRFFLMVAVTLCILCVTYFEYYYFCLTIKKTTHLWDALSPLILGIVQGAAICSLVPNVGNQGWWRWEISYVILGMVSLWRSSTFVRRTRMAAASQLVLRRTILLSIRLGTGVIGVLTIHFVWKDIFHSRTPDELLLILVTVIAVLIPLKSQIWLAIWEESEGSEAATD